MQAFITINFHHKTAFAAARKFWYVVFCFLFVSRCFCFPLISSLIHRLFRSVLFNFHVSVNFPAFFVLLISSFILLRLEKILDIISVFLNLLRLVLENLCSGVGGGGAAAPGLYNHFWLSEVIGCVPGQPLVRLCDCVGLQAGLCNCSWPGGVSGCAPKAR